MLNLTILLNGLRAPACPLSIRLNALALRCSLVVAIICAYPVFGFSAPPVIRYLGIKQGLSNNLVRAIYQDHHGFMWFGTYDGLNRFDGYNFKIFRNRLNDSSSIQHNYINAIGEDRHNRLWVGTGQGISIYNELSSGFTTGFYLPHGGKRLERIPFNINSIKPDLQGNLYIGTNGGGFLMQPVNSDTVYQVSCGKDQKGVCRNDVQGVVIDMHQKVWLFIRELGLCRYNPVDKEPIRVVSDSITAANCMEKDAAGNLWIGTAGGLLKYNVNTGTFQPVALKLTSNVITSLTFDRQHQLWIGTEGGSIDILDTNNGQLTYLLAGENKNALSSEDISTVYEDRATRKWIGTAKGGVNIADLQQNNFQKIEHDPLNPNSLSGNFVSAFYEDHDQELWVGTDGRGISIWDRKLNDFTKYSHQPGDPQSLSYNSVSSFREDYLGDLWIATYGGGICKYNKSQKTFKRYDCVEQLNGDLQPYIFLLYEDRQKNLWAATYGSGRLYLLNRQTDRFEVFCPDPVDIYSITEDQNGILWAGTPYGLFRVNKKNHTYDRYEITKPVRAILEDKIGQLWLGTEGVGLNLFDRSKNQVIARFTDADGLCNNSVLNILEDDSGNLWLSTFQGLSKFDPVNKTFKNYYESDGLQSNQFLYNAALRLSTGEMLFGGVNGFTIFNPDSLQFHGTTPPVFLTGLRINNEAVNAGSNYIRQADSSGIKKLVIPYNDAVLSFDFTALEYSLPEKISYAYYLQGWDKGWNYTGTTRTANYTRLKEGTYYLHIKSTNAAGDWNPNELTLEVVVLPPWFRSWWAYLAYVAVVVSLIYLFMNYRNRQNRLQYEVKLAQIETQNEKEVNEKKLSFFTDISHEFRTPLTLIINPVKDMIDDVEKRKDGNHLNTVYRNARRLLTLVDQLLLFRKAETSANRLKISRLNFSNLSYEVYLSFAQEAKSRNIDFQYRCQGDMNVYGDRQKLEIALYNLLSNAVKYTPYSGKITFEIVENYLFVIATVADSGPGIPEEAGDQVFNKFYQAIDKNSVSKPGFGIGLSLVKNIAESHFGSIRYESVLGKGTTFILTTPKGKEVFHDYFIGEEEEPGMQQAINGDPLPEKAKPQGAEKLEELVRDSATLLVAEDNDQLRNYIVSIFTPLYKVYEALNAEQALQIAKDQLPDLILSDNLMGGMTGLELCQIIKRDPALGHIPVVIITGSHSSEGRLKGMEHGADDYIVKPFEKDFLLARVANLLQSRSQLQSYFYNEITLQKNTLKVSEEYKVFLENCIAIVEKHLDDEDFSIKTLANEIGMSHSKIYRIVKSISGQSINAFIRFIRLRKAAELLINTDMNVNETSFEVGISDVRYFRAQFNKLFGMNPSEYIKKYRKAFATGYRLNKERFKKDKPE